MSYDVILSWRSVHLYSRSVFKRTSPLAVVSLRVYLSYRWYDALWMHCVHVMRAAASGPHDKVTSSVNAAYKQACPLTDRKLGAAEALPCLICQQRSLVRRLPASSQRPCLTACTTPSWTAVLIQPVWHICCLSHCVVPVCELSATRAKRAPRPLGRCLQPGLVLTNRPAPYAPCRGSGGLTKQFMHLCSPCHKPLILAACRKCVKHERLH